MSDLLKRAAEIIRREASLFVRPGSDDYNEMVELADELEAFAAEQPEDDA